MCGVTLEPSPASRAAVRSLARIAGAVRGRALAVEEEVRVIDVE
jgi:hypothetical protein